MIAYHPDPEINREVAAEVLANEAFDVLIARLPPRRWMCPLCGTSHSRGHLGAIGTHRCLSCGYVGTGGVMWDPEHKAKPTVTP